MKRFIVSLCSFALAVTAAWPCWAEGGDISRKVRKNVDKAIEIRQSTQKDQERWRQEREKLTAVYEQLKREQELLQARNDRLEQQTAAARERVAVKEKQLADIERIAAEINPFLRERVESLRRLVADDTPFLKAEREKRIARLDELMEDPEAPVSEKFRKTMEALLIEAEYGTTIEVYQDTIDIQGRPTLVNLFRLGRISLFYQTLDHKTCGIYDVAVCGWRPLDKSYNHAIQTAIEIGARRRPVELLTLPLGRLAAP